MKIESLEVTFRHPALTSDGPVQQMKTVKHVGNRNFFTSGQKISSTI